MKKVISIFIALVIGCSCLVTAFAGDKVYVTYNANISTSKFPAQVYDADADVILPTDTAIDGYTFNGWYLDSDYTVTANGVKATADMTIYGKWTKNDSYTLTYAVNNNIKTFPAESYVAGTAITFPKTDVDGYTFDGWYKDSKYTEKFTLTVMPSADTTIYGKYTKNEVKYTLSFETNGNNKTDSLSYISGATIEFPKMEVDGYEFVGWFADKDCSKVFTSKTMPAEDTTLYGLYFASSEKINKDINNKDLSSYTADIEMTVDSLKKISNSSAFSMYAVKYIKNLQDNIDVAITKDSDKGIILTFKFGTKTFDFTIPGDFDSLFDEKETTSEVTEQETTEVIENETEIKTETTTNVAEIEEEIPDTGSSLVITVISVLSLISACAASIFIYKKKKEN